MIYFVMLEAQMLYDKEGVSLEGGEEKWIRGEGYPPARFSHLLGGSRCPARNSSARASITGLVSSPGFLLSQTYQAATHNT